MNDPFAGLGSFFFASDPKSASAQDMRRKIALAMIMKKNAAPKTLGEGLYSIGDSLGDAFMSRSAIAQAQAASEQADKQIESISKLVPGSATIGPRAEADTEDSPAIIAAPRPQVAAVAPAPQVAAAPEGNFGYRPPPAYLQASLANSGLDPERQAYLGHLAGREARSANEVSPTGAAGPFQFIRSTGRQYGLIGPEGDRRTDPDASIAAVNRLTDDNAAILARGLGRAPTGSELALAHQQGAGTAVKMLTGTGNASAYNLSVNNASGGPQQAAQKIMSYYGMPDRGGAQVAAATAAPTSANAPITPADVAQEERVADVVGMNRGPTNASFSYPQTASRTGDVISDAPQPGIIGAPNGPMRDAIADTIQQRQQTLQPPQPDTPPLPGPQLAQANVFPPVQSAGGQVAPIIPGGGLPPPPAPAIPAAPPDQRGAIRAAPVDEYVPRNRPPPEPPRKPGPGPVEQRLLPVLSSDVDERVKKAAELRIQQERTLLGADYEEKLKIHEAQKTNWLEEQKQELQFKIGRQKTQADIGQTLATTTKTLTEADKAKLELGGYPAQLVQEKLKREAEVGKAQAEAETKQEEARIVKRTGMDPVKLYERFDKDKASVDQTIKAQSAQQLARKAIRDGVITGYGANGALVSAKFADWAFKNGMSGNMAANTEIMSSTLKAGLSEAIKTVNGEGGTGVSNTDVRIAEGIQGSDPNLQLKTIQTIMDRAAEINHRKIDNYETKVDRYLSGEKAEDFYKIGGSTVSPDKLKILFDDPSEQRKAQFDQVHGPGAANLELSRFRRAKQRRGED